MYWMHGFCADQRVDGSSTDSADASGMAGMRVCYPIAMRYVSRGEDARDMKRVERRGGACTAGGGMVC